MAIRILNDLQQDKFLDDEGYAVIPFLNAAETKILVDLFHENHPETKEGLYATAHSSSKEFKQRLNDEILNQFTRATAETFFECRPLGGSYIVKYKGEKGVLYPHQDWNIVDEDFYRSFNIWVPLVDTNDENGALAVLPHSHKLIKSYRGVNIADPFYKVNGYTWQYHKTVHMKAGEALIYDHRLLHASAVNQTDAPRLAVVFGIIPEKAEMRYYYLENGIVSEYENNVDFFFNNDILKGPQGLKKIKDIDYQIPVVTEEEFDELYLGKKPEPKKAEPQSPPEQPERVVEPDEINKSLFQKIMDWMSI
ncbi:MAG: glycosyl transferase family 2 [Bacteroidota bacterium]|nr:glycosyl transferase family 2 [Bacteroidota bacterium]